MCDIFRRGKGMHENLYGHAADEQCFVVFGCRSWNQWNIPDGRHGKSKRNGRRNLAR